MVDGTSIMSWRVLNLGEGHRAMLHHIGCMRLLLHLERHSDIYKIVRTMRNPVQLTRVRAGHEAC